MVSTVHAMERLAGGQIDRTAWFNRLSLRYPHEKLQALSKWFGMADERGLRIASILVDLHADLDAILAALLYSQRDKIDEIPILKSLRGLDHMGSMLSSQKKTARIEQLRQMMLFMVRDIRVVLVKLAERTCAIREVKSLPQEDQVLLAHEIMELYAPLANRLGVGALKWELEDRAFAILEKEAYLEITQVLKSKRLEREIFIHNFIENLQRMLEGAQILAQVSGRVKHIYSIWRKMQKKQLAFSDLYDLRAVRILVPDVATCYEVMALLHAEWEPLVAQYTDYISHPKRNGYQSLHTVLLGEDGLAIEVQIRTFAMHEAAESGIAAHWRYKEGGGSEALSQRINWLKLLLDVMPEEVDRDVFVFTRDHEVMMLQKGATPIDFAFMVHTDLGLRCKGASVNGQIVPLTYPLQMGDQVEVVLHKTARPSRDWLIASEGFLATKQARRKLGAFFRAQAQEDGIASERCANREVPSFGAKRGVSEQVLDQRSVQKKSQTFLEGASRIQIQGVSNLAYQLAKCCHPEPGDLVIGSITRLRGIVIHRESCSNVAYFQLKRPERLFKVDWET
ncbi:MAG: HD domain-containing protein [Gammaproteobacteria bacterium]|nr:HD domain-containing protein [Gammaproteobacteria bacterium]